MADPTPVFGISRFDEDDTAEQDVLMNAHATDLENALITVHTRIIGTDAQRTGLIGDPRLVEGVKFYATDTNKEWKYNGSSWFQLRGSAYFKNNPGSPVTGVGLPTAAMDLPGGVEFKIGSLTIGTTVAFGNEYFPVVTFDTPFPNAALHISITPLSSSPTTSASGSPIALDSLSASSFRALIASSGTAQIRAFMWLAIGY